MKIFLLLKVYVFFGECRKLNLLSFGEEAEEEEKELAAVKQKIKSSHDVLSDPRLLKQEQALIPYLSWCAFSHFLFQYLNKLFNHDQAKLLDAQFS